MIKVELKGLVGLHELSGCDRVTGPSIAEWALGEVCEWFTFVLDDTAYVAIEDPDDGYRSTMNELRTADAAEVKNRFPPVLVSCAMRPGPDDVLDMTDTATGLIVLSVGTDHQDGYYPVFVAQWNPQNMAANQAQQG